MILNGDMTLIKIDWHPHSVLAHKLRQRNKILCSTPNKDERPLETKQSWVTSLKLREILEKFFPTLSEDWSLVINVLAPYDMPRETGE